MAEIPLQIWWNNLSSWINDQVFQWQAWRYDFAFWVDTQRFDARPLRPSELVFTYPSTINCIFNRSKVAWNWNIIWLNDWKIYNNTALVTTLTQWIQWSKIGYMKPLNASDFKLYYFHETIPTINPKYIHRSNTDWTWMEQSYRNYTSDTWYQFLSPPAWMQIMNLWNRILFTNYNSIWQIDNNEIVTRLILFPNNENVVWITQFQWQFKVYTSTWFLSSKIYTWDWTSKLPDISLDMNWIFINSVVNDWAYDYVMTDSWLYQIAWVQYQQLYNIYWKLHSKIDNDLIMTVFNSTNTQARWQLCKYSSKPWYAKGIHPYCLTDITQNESITANIDYAEQDVFYSVFSKLFRLVWNPQTWNHTCYVSSLFFMWNNIRYEKKADYIDLKMSWFTTETVKVYAQTTDEQLNNNTWVKLWEWNNSTISTNNSWLKINSQQFLNPLWNFNKIRFKVEFEKNQFSSWRFYWLDLFGKQDIWK